MNRGLSEIFTGDATVEKFLDDFPVDIWEEGKSFIDPECGDGQFLVAVAKRKIAHGHTEVLSTIYGVDIMADNIDTCKQRLLDVCGDTEENRATINRNIRCENALEYDFSFE